MPKTSKNPTSERNTILQPDDICNWFSIRPTPDGNGISFRYVDVVRTVGNRAENRRNFKIHSTQIIIILISIPLNQVDSATAGISKQVMTTMVIGPLDDHTYCVRAAFTHLWLWRKQYECLSLHFTTSQCIRKCV